MTTTKHSKRILYGLRIRTELLANPDASIAELVAHTGAPREVCLSVKMKWLQELAERAEDDAQ